MPEFPIKVPDGTRIIHDDFWNCECSGQYIHAKINRRICIQCHTRADKHNDSRIDELEAGGRFYTIEDEGVWISTKKEEVRKWRSTR